MRKRIQILIAVVMLLSLSILGTRVPDAAEESGKTATLSTNGKRTLWTTSKIQGTPEPPRPYRTEVAFPTVKFDQPLSLALVPGTDRMAVAERYGKIFTFRLNAKTARKQLLLNVGRTVYGVVLHPQFAENGYLYVSSILNPKVPSAKGSRVSRFQVKDPKTLRADRNSERVLLEWPSGGHNGGCLRFGPDGYLYIAIGDASGIADLRKTGQDISDLPGSILRIDVDHSDKGRPYGIPADNPFVNTAGARPEIYSYGHRQVWKYSFDPATGNLWAGEVGQDLWEMIYLIQKGGNYGWSVNEGSHPFRPERKKGPSPFVPPVVEQSHNEFRSITGGYVYHGSRLPDLKNAYIYGDYDTGRIWSFKYENGKPTEHRELADTQLRLVEFGQDSSGEVYLLDFVSGMIHRLVKAPPPPKDVPEFPRLLSQTGLFESTKDHDPLPGLIPYSVNAPLWSDNALKDRFIALPGDSKIEYNVVTYPQPAPGAQPGWRFPDGTVMVKTFSLEMEVGNPATARRLETRILHHEKMPGKDDEYGAQVWRGYTYVWNDEQTDAELLDAKGADRTFTITDANAPGGKRQQTWHFPSRAECTLCHTMSSKYVLGVNTLQMNKDHDYGGTVANQLTALEQMGVFTKKMPQRPEKQPRLVDYRNKNHDVNLRARSYLQANCSHCHRKWGGGNAEFQLLASLPLKETGTIGVRPGHGLFDIEAPQLIAPGNAGRSMILVRMQKLGLGRMPHIASSVIDEGAIELIREWIKQSADRKSQEQTGITTGE